MGTKAAPLGTSASSSSITPDRLFPEFRKAADTSAEELARWASQHLNIEIGIDTTPVRNADGRFDYRFRDRGKLYTLPASKVFHMRAFGGGDGLGLSAIKHGVHSFGSALAADQTAGTMFKNGMVASGVLKSGQVLDEKQRGQLEKLLDRYTSSAKAGKIMTLEAGLEYQPLQINPEDAQLLETRRFQVEDVCRWFGTPPVVIGHAGQGQTMWGSGVEAIMLAWLTLGINPQLRRNEARIAKDLVPPGKRGRWYVEWNREAMLQMDSKSKGEFLSKMISNGIISRDEGCLLYTSDAADE